METILYAKNKSLVTAFRAMTSLQFSLQPNKYDAVLQIPSRDSERSIKAHVYNTKNATGPTPVILNFHGSGFALPLHGSDDEYCHFVAQHTQYTILDIQYRLAPECPFPAAVNDVEDCINYVLARPGQYDLAHVSTSGFSAGANLALVGALAFPGKIESVISMYAWADQATDPADKNAPDVERSTMMYLMLRTFASGYCPAGIALTDPRISPAFADLEALPPTLISITAGSDILAPEMEELAEKARKLGKNVLSRRMEGCEHGWDKMAKEGTEKWRLKNEAYQFVVDGLNSATA